jgi:hypothetical protein
MRPSIGRDKMVGGSQRFRSESARGGVMRSLRRTSLVVAIAVAMLATVAGPTDAGPVLQVVPPDAVLAWNANAGEAAVAACISPVGDPLHESRMYAMTHVAIHDALNAIDLRSRPYAFHGAAGPLASPDAAVAAAARNVLVTLIGQLPEPPVPQACRDAGIASVEADYTAALAAIPDGPAETQGVEVGAAAAAAILALRADDGSDTLLLDFDYPRGTEPGEYQFTSPDLPFAFAPGWGDVTPFVLHSSSQFHVRPPYRLTGKKYAADFNEVKRLGSTTSTERTTEQTQIALFWVESSPLAWNRIARTVSADQGTDLWGNARLFGLLNMALADGYVGTFEVKYELNFWRPITAIRAADTDGNPDTDFDATWTPLVTTPPIPEHDSGHSVEGGVAAQVLRRFFGTDQVSFENCSMTLPAGSTCTDASPLSRSYTSFTQAAAENGLSRILVGFHFRNAVEQGIKHGTRIGDRAFRLFLRPVH